MEIRNDDQFAYRQESDVHGSDDQTAAFFAHLTILWEDKRRGIAKGYW